MKRRKSPRLGIGALLLSLMLAPLFVAPAGAQEEDSVHYVNELHDGVEVTDPLELAQGFDTWWKRHNPDYESGTYAIVDEPTAPGSVAALHLGIDSEVDNEGTRDQARVMAYIELDTLDPEDPPELPDARGFFEQGLSYTMYVEEGSDLGSATQLVVEVFYGLDVNEMAPRFTTLQLMPEVEEAGTWQTFEWTSETATYSSVDGTTAPLEVQLQELYDQAEADGEMALNPSAIGFGLNLGSALGATVDTYIDNVTVGSDTFKFGEDPAPTLTEWPESAYQGDTVTVVGTNLTDATVELNGAGEVEATISDDGTELSFVVPEDAALGVRPVVITTPHGVVQFNLEVLERVDDGHPGFTDVPDTHLFFGEIMWLADQDITRGCNPPVNDMFCPDDSITRGQMAAFLNRALDWPASDVDGFEDDGHSVFEGDLNAAKAQDVFRGCNPPLNTLSCVDDPITRGEMAAVIVRALDLPAGEEDAFTDDDLSVFEGDINALAAADVTRGCNPPANTEFCPDRNITRGEMAAFLFRALADRLDDNDDAMES